MIVCREKSTVTIVHIARPHNQITDRDTGKPDLIAVRIFKKIEQRVHPSVTPPNNTDPVAVNKIVVLDHVVPTGFGVGNLQPPVIDPLLKPSSVTRATSVFRSRDHIALSE